MDKIPELIDIYDYYIKNFCIYKSFIVYTNFKPLEKIQIVFEENQLHHLLGLHKVTNNRASKNIDLIKRNLLTISNIRQHNKFSEIKFRLIGFFSIGNMFLNQTSKFCILAKDIGSNTMDLDVIFYDEIDTSSIMILGLRKRQGSDIYAPTTLFRTRKDKYDKIRKAKIIDIKTLD